MSLLRRLIRQRPATVGATILLGLGLVLGCGSFGSCGGGGAGGSGGDVGAVSKHVPRDTSFVAATSSVKKFFAPIEKQWQKTRKDLDSSSDLLAQWKKAKKQAEEEANFDWKRFEAIKTGAGIDYDGPAMGTVTDDQKIVLAFVGIEDRAKFNEFLPKLFGGVEVESKTVDGVEVRALNPPDGKDIPPFAWAFGDGVVTVGLHNFGEMEPTRSAVAAHAPELDSSESLHGHEGFEQFQSAALDGKSAGVFFNPESETAEQFLEAVKSRWCGEYRTFESGVCESVSAHTSGVGFAGSLRDGSDPNLRGWIGLDSEGREFVTSHMGSGASYDWSNFATKDLIASARLSVDSEKAFDSFRSALKSEVREGLDRQIASVEKMTGGNLDVEKDVAGGMSGDVGIFLYNLAGLQGGVQGSMQAAAATKYAVVLPFESSEALDRVMKAVRTGIERQAGGSDVLSSDTKKGVTVWESKSESGRAAAVPRLYKRDNVAVVAGRGFPTSQVVARLNGESAGGTLTDADGVELAGPMLDSQGTTGVYIHSERLIDNLKGQFSRIPGQVWSAAKFTKEHSMILESGSGGVVLEWKSRNDLDELRESLSKLEGMLKGLLR